MSALGRERLPSISERKGGEPQFAAFSANSSCWRFASLNSAYMLRI